MTLADQAFDTLLAAGDTPAYCTECAEDIAQAVVTPLASEVHDAKVGRTYHFADGSVLLAHSGGAASFETTALMERALAE